MPDVRSAVRALAGVVQACPAQPRVEHLRVHDVQSGSTPDPDSPKCRQDTTARGLRAFGRLLGMARPVERQNGVRRHQVGRLSNGGRAPCIVLGIHRTHARARRVGATPMRPGSVRPCNSPQSWHTCRKHGRAVSTGPDESRQRTPCHRFGHPRHSTHPTTCYLGLVQCPHRRCISNFHAICPAYPQRRDMGTRSIQPGVRR